MTEETKYKDKWCQEAYERGKAEVTKELQEENKKLKLKLDALSNEVPWKDILEKNEQIKKLEVQIEKMKNGHNCKHHYFYQQDIKCEFTYCDCINCKDKWELAE